MEKIKFLKRINASRAEGLVDIKFLVKHGESMSAEEFMAAANRIDQAIAEGRCSRTRTWNKDQEPKLSALLTQ